MKARKSKGFIVETLIYARTTCFNIVLNLTCAGVWLLCSQRSGNEVQLGESEANSKKNQRESEANIENHWQPEPHQTEFPENQLVVVKRADTVILLFVHFWCAMCGNMSRTYHKLQNVRNFSFHQKQECFFFFTKQVDIRG